MKNKTLLFPTALLLIVGFAAWSPIKFKQSASGAEPQKPNIILIMSDDMGYSDLGCYGGEAQTPNLNQLAKNGLRYTNFYNTARCCPSRASLMTGLYPHQAGMGWMTSDDYNLPGYRGDLSHKAVTIAEVMKTAGYDTYMTGKWHLNFKPQPQGRRENWPLQRGFDHYYGTLLGAANYGDPGYLVRDSQIVNILNDKDYQPKEYYFTDAISDNSVKFIAERNKEKPFFMYVAYTAAHWPLQAPESAVAKYKGRFDKGYEALREERLARMKKLGVVAQDVQLSPYDGKPWAKETDKPAILRRMETYAAMIDVMDQGIGRIIAQLKKDGIFENTVVLFMQDNGACAEILGNGEIRPIARNPEGLQPRKPEQFTMSNNPPILRNGKLVMEGRKVMAGPYDTYISYMQEWANVSNTPLRKFKHYVHEGGISTPLIVHWPNGVKSKNEIRKQPGHLIDIMPTIAQIGGATYPKTYKGNQITPVEGKSLVPSFTNQEINREAIYWDHEMNRAIRMGKWKLVSEANLKNMTYSPEPWELYDVEKDRAESNNLASQNPELVKKMSAMWEAYANRAQVYPSPWQKVERN